MNVLISKSDLIRNLVVISLTLSFLSCGNSREENIRNACIEMSSTSVGFTGPSKRMEIMKNYGFDVELAAALNVIIRSNFNAAQEWSWRPQTESCIRNQYSCEAVLNVFFDEELVDLYMTQYAEGLRSCM